MKAPPFDLIETMRFENGISLLTRHMARLRRSADHFGFPLVESRIVSEVKLACQALDARTPARVRLLLDATGKAIVSTAPLTYFDGDLHVAFSSSRVQSGDDFLRHKTTNRALYDREWRSAQERGLFEVLYLNEEDMLTEGSRTNIFVRVNGRFATPPLTAGLLPGVYRSLLLDTFPNTVEMPLTEHQVRGASQVYVCNAVIGLRKVRLIDSLFKDEETHQMVHEK